MMFPLLVKMWTRILRHKLFIFVIVLYFSSHLINFSTAPWNQNGLFDDAAWDIYFAKNHVFAGIPFQAAYFDNVGLISREVVFHYYISIFFKLFGYNLLIFNISLLILGFITILFTTLIIQRLFKNVFITVLSAIIINFFPLHFLHIFAGHRYAIAAPLVVVSLYYLYTAFANNSRFRTFIFGQYPRLQSGVKNEKRIPKEDTPLVAPTNVGAKLQNGASEAGVCYTCLGV